MDELKVENKRSNTITSKLTSEVNKLKTELRQKENEISALKRKQDHLEDYSRKINLRFQGLPEARGENPELVLRKFLQEHLKLQNVESVKYAKPVHRIGRIRDGHTRDIIACFESFHDRQHVWQQRKSLKDTCFYITEDLSAGTEAARRALHPYRIAAIKSGKKATMVADRLIIDGRSYTTTNLPPFTPEHTVETKDYIFFFGKLSPFSNFHPADIEVDGIVYNCVEQYFQYQYTLHHRKDEAAEAILSETNPATQK